MADAIVVDGSRGEGGGQIVRVSLALAAATQSPVIVRNVRANRSRPGMRPQHVTAAEALSRITDGRVSGAHVDSTEVALTPGPVVGGEFAFHVGTAGSVTLVLQALLPACAASRQAFTFTLTGGTDVPFAPTWDHFTRVHVPLLERFGLAIEADAVKRGYFPAGGGEVRVHVDAGGFRAADVVKRGPVRAIDGLAHAHGLKKSIVQRGAEALTDALLEGGFPGAQVEIETHRGPGRGFHLAAWATCGETVLGTDAVGLKRVPAETAARRAAQALVADLRSGVAVDAHEADALPVFLALAGGGAFTTRAVSSHTRTTLDLLPSFLPVTPVTEPDPVAGTRVRVAGTRGSA